jgi:serine/threonine protein phosphatase 1
MGILAIGDIHGCLHALDTLLEAVGPTPQDWIITLGDYVDRGPDSRGVIDRLLELSQTGQLIALRGNHEQMMVDVRQDEALMPMWLQYGGQATLDSYAPDGRAGSVEDVPDAHWNFLDLVCVDWFETETHFFVHADVLPNLLLADQPTTVLRWQRAVNPQPHHSGKIMICGHTVQQSGWPAYFGFAVCLDTWVYGDGWLTCLETESGLIWQANERGEHRTAHICDFYIPPDRSPRTSKP